MYKMLSVMCLLALSAGVASADSRRSPRGIAGKGRVESAAAGAKARTVEPTVSAPAPSPPAGVRTVKYGEQDLVPLRTRVGFATLVVLPAGESIVEVSLGDADVWVVNVSQNLAYVKPAKAGMTSNLNLVSSRGIVYSFYLVEKTGQEPDLKVFVEPRGGIVQALEGPARYVPAVQVESCRKELEAARAERAAVERKTRSDLDQQQARSRNDWVDSLRFDYEFESGKRPFVVQGIFSDGRNTYIRAQASEPPVLYEERDGKASLVNFTYRQGGTYVAGRVLERGYLALGEKKLRFRRKE